MESSAISINAPPDPGISEFSSMNDLIKSVEEILSKPPPGLKSLEVFSGIEKKLESLSLDVELYLQKEQESLDRLNQVMMNNIHVEVDIDLLISESNAPPLRNPISCDKLNELQEEFKSQLSECITSKHELIRCSIPDTSYQDSSIVFFYEESRMSLFIKRVSLLSTKNYLQKLFFISWKTRNQKHKSFWVLLKFFDRLIKTVPWVFLNTTRFKSCWKETLSWCHGEQDIIYSNTT